MPTLHPGFIVAFVAAVLTAGASLPAQAHKHHWHGGDDRWGGRGNEWAEQRWREREAREWAWRHQPRWSYSPYYCRPYGYGFGHRYGWSPIGMAGPTGR